MTIVTDSTPRATPSSSQGELESLADQPQADDLSRIGGVLSRAVRQAAELRRFAEEARGTDDEVSEFYERCALTQTEQATEAKQLLIARSLTHRAEAVTSAAFAAGDGATDADVAPSSERRSVRIWPAQ
jgi:hypothetical protein